MEKMTDFFTARVDIYDDHMIHEVEGCREGYLKMAELVPEKTKTLLDLGCGTGLELEAIWTRNPGIAVTGIDLTAAMLERLKKKYSDRDVTLIEADYMACELGTERYDAAVSFQTLHHFTHEEKLKLVKGEYYHFDMPCTMDNQKRLLRQAGFTEVEVVWRQENTTILYANR